LAGYSLVDNPITRSHYPLAIRHCSSRGSAIAANLFHWRAAAAAMGMAIGAGD